MCMQSRCTAALSNVYKIKRIPWKFFKRIKRFLFLIDFNFLIFTRKRCSSIIEESVHPECLDRNATDRNFLGPIETNMATKYFYEFFPDSNKLVNKKKMKQEYFEIRSYIHSTL